MSEEINDLFDEFSAPSAMAGSMLKRFQQFKRALPGTDHSEVFTLILDNRYKLMGNVVPIPERAEIIRKSNNSLCLLTLNTMLSESPELSGRLSSAPKDLRWVLDEIHRVIAPELKSEKTTDDLFEIALDLV